MSDHLKRLAAPRSWPLKRKVSVWATKQSPGAHSIEYSLSAALVLRDMLAVCDTAREAKRIIGDRALLVDGKPVRSPKEPLGFMDTLSIPKMDLYYRILMTDKGKLTAEKISKEEAAWKLCRIEGKTKIKEGKIQLNLHDGRNITLDKNQYKTGDVLKLDVLEQKILDVYPLAEGASAMVSKGKHAGKIEVVSEYVVVRGAVPNVVKFKDGTETVKDNVFVIGKDTPAIEVPEASL